MIFPFRNERRYRGGAGGGDDRRRNRKAGTCAQVLGRGAHGPVVLAHYRGTPVALKRFGPRAPSEPPLPRTSTPSSADEEWSSKHSAAPPLLSLEDPAVAAGAGFFGRGGSVESSASTHSVARQSLGAAAPPSPGSMARPSLGLSRSLLSSAARPSLGAIPTAPHSGPMARLPSAAELRRGMKTLTSIRHPCVIRRKKNLHTCTTSKYPFVLVLGSLRQISVQVHHRRHGCVRAAARPIWRALPCHGSDGAGQLVGLGWHPRPYT